MNALKRLVVPALGAFACVFAFAAPVVPAGAPEPCAEEILAEAGATLRALRAEHPDARFLAFWDCDGTILKGDCTEGLVENGAQTYAGLAQVCIERGFSRVYPAEGGHARAREDYDYLCRRVGNWLGYPYMLQMLAGADARLVQETARAHFERELAPHVFSAARRVLDGLTEAGVENHVLTASAERFVRGGAAALGVVEERIHGIRVREIDGRLTRELVYPVTYGDGKRERLLEILAEERARTPGRPVFVLAAFGNSHGTDGAYMAWVAGQALPAGRPLAVMFNGGAEPDEYRGLFRRFEIGAVVGGP